MTIARIFDTETTGLEAPEVIQAAWGEVHLDSPRTLHNPVNQFFFPSKGIETGALATHHIILEDLVDCPPSSTFKAPASDYTIGYNVDFDWEVAGKFPGKRICTLALARKVWKNTSHSQGALLYHLLPHSEARNLLRQAHDALADIQICAIILEALIRELKPTSWEHLWAMSEDARIPEEFTFGKHKGEKIADVARSDSGYLSWCLKQSDMDPYVHEAIRRARRGGAA